MAVLCPAERRLFFRSALRLAGPAFAVSIGYIDPGNWASDLAAGAYGLRLLWVVLAANAIAIVLQIAVTRVTIAYDADLATLIGARWPRLCPALWATFQGAAIATDLAEFTGIVIGAQLLFGLSTLQAVLAGLAIVGIMLALGGRRRTLDTFVVGAIVAIALAFGFLVFALQPEWGGVARGLAIPAIPDAGALLVVVAIVGATVMPHNLFLHSALVHKRCRETPATGNRSAQRFFAGETFIALNAATAINAAILIVGACLHARGGSIDGAFGALIPLAGTGAAVLFGSALLISGIAASITATLSGDYIFAALAPFRVPSGVRRAITIFPAAALLLAHVSATALLIWSQIALCLILPLVLVPLLGLLRNAPGSAPSRFGRFFGLCAFATSACIVLDAALLAQTIHS